MAWLIFMGWVISQPSEWEDYSNYLGEEGGDFRELGHCPPFFFLPSPPTSPLPTFLTFYGWPQNGHDARGYVI